MTDERIDRARAYLSSHLQDTSTLPISALARQLDDTRRHLAPMLSAVSPGVDSERWTCQGCGALMIGRRPAGDRCRDCTPAAAEVS